MAPRRLRCFGRLAAAAAVLAGGLGVAAAPPASGIVGGWDASAEWGEAIAQIAIDLSGDGVVDTLSCTGVLVHPRWVLTAHHCLANDKPDAVMVRVGHLDWWQGGELHQVSEVHMHPDYQGGAEDLALLRLSSPSFRRPEPLAKPADIALWDGDPASSNDYGIAIGWGFTDAGGTVLPTRLQAAVLQVAPDGDDELGHKRITLQPTGAAGPCQGDSGSPLLVTAADGRRLVAGILKAADCKGSGWYTEVGAGPNYDWILKVVPAIHDDRPIITTSISVDSVRGGSKVAQHTKPVVRTSTTIGSLAGGARSLGR